MRSQLGSHDTEIKLGGGMLGLGVPFCTRELRLAAHTV